MTNPPLRLLVLVPVMITVTLGFTVFAAYVDGVEQRSRIADVDEELVRASSAGRPALPPGGPPGAVDGPPPGAPDGPGPFGPPPDGVEAADQTLAPPVQLLLDGSGAVVAGAPDVIGEDDRQALARAVSDTGERHVRTLDGPNLRAMALGMREGRIAVTALSLDTVDRAVSEFRSALTVGGLIIIGLVGLVVWILTRRIIHPVTQLTETAERIGNGELDVQLLTDGGSRETTRLAAFLQRMLSTLRDDVERSSQQAAESDHARDVMARFLADTANEVRTPLSALQGYSELYKDGRLLDDGGIERAMDRIGQESGRLNRLAADMLALAQGQYRDDEIPEFVELHRIAENVVDDLQAAFPRHPVRLHSVVTDGPYVRGRAERIHQALLNVGANACQHSPCGEPVDITMREVDGFARVEIIDRGTGVAAENTESIFQPFVRSGSPSWDGAGLGLAVARRIARANNGRLTVQQTDGGGATFVLTLPLA